MSQCVNQITQNVPTEFDVKLVDGTCGQTGLNGDPVFCPACTENGNKRAWLKQQQDLKFNDF